MRRFTASISTLILGLVGCAGDNDDTLQLSERSRTAFTALGVSDIAGDGAPFQLLDADGEQIGELQIGEDVTQVALHGDTVRSTRSPERAVIECNGVSVAYSPADGTISADAQAIVEPCSDALAAAAALVGAEDPHQQTRFRGLATCTGLGSNYYCDGSTLMINHDWLCTNCNGQWVETYDSWEQNSSVCTSWWW